MVEDHYTPPPPPPGDAYGHQPPPPPGPPYDGPARPPIPWEQRDRLGFFPALIETIKLFLTRPREAYQRTPESTGDYVGPILYVLVLSFFGAIFTFIYQVMGLDLGSSFPGVPSDPSVAVTTGVIGIVSLILTPIFSVIIVFIFAGLLHLAMQVLGGLNESKAGYEGSVRAVAFATSTQVLLVVPFIGSIVASFWALALYVFGLAALHRSTEQKSLLAVVLLFVACCLCAIGFGVLMVSLGLGAGALAGGASG